MNVYLTTLDKKSEEDLQIILDMFSKDLGPLEFKHLESDYKGECFQKYRDLQRLGVNNIKEICDSIKEENKINGYLVLLTSKGLDIPVLSVPKDKDWHSVFLSENIAINTSRWKKLTDNRPYLAIAHQIIENLFQSLSHLEINSQKLYRDIHVDMEVCINDYCKNLNETKSKISSGLICTPCQERFMVYTQNKTQLQQIRNILKRISDRCRDNYDLSPTETDKRIRIDDSGNIFLADTLIKFNRSTTVMYTYLFYLINYNNKISQKDFDKSEEVQQKYLDLVKTVGKGKSDFVFKSFVKGLRSHVARGKDYLLNNLQNEAIVGLFYYRSETDSKEVNYYYISAEEKDVDIHEFFNRFRLK